MVAETRRQLLKIALRWAETDKPSFAVGVDLDGAVHDYLGALEDQTGERPVMAADVSASSKEEQVVVAVWRWLSTKTDEEEAAAARHLRIVVSAWTASSEIEITPHIGTPIACASHVAGAGDLRLPEWPSGAVGAGMADFNAAAERCHERVFVAALWWAAAADPEPHEAAGLTGAVEDYLEALGLQYGRYPIPPVGILNEASDRDVLVRAAWWWAIALQGNRQFVDFHLREAATRYLRAVLAVGG